MIQPSAYASKMINDRKLYKRAHGAQYALSVGANTLDFTVPYGHVKYTALEIIGGELLDTASCYVLDNASGSYSGYPYAQLNQFGYSVNISKDYHLKKSSFDADLYGGMIIRIVYTSISAKTIGLNYELDELK